MPKNHQEQFLDAQKSVEQTASVMEHLFFAPKPAVLIIPILLVSLILGALIGFDIDDPIKTFFINGILILAVPTYLSGFLSGPIAESLGGKFYLRRSMLLSFLCLLIIGGVLIIFWIIKRFFTTDLENFEALIFGYSAIIWLRHLILLSTSNSSHVKSLPASIIQPVLGYLFIFLFISPFGLREGILTAVTLLIFLFAVILLTTIATAPMKKAFGINGLSMLRYSLDHITEGGESGASDLEKFFESFSEKMDAHVGLIAFRSKGKIKSIMIVPSVHPGPFGLLGGSDLPLKLKNGLLDKSKNVLVPHGSATHDMNLSSSEEKSKIEKTVKELLTKVEYSIGSSRFIRHHDSMDVSAQVFGNGILAIHTSSPNPTDDVDYSTGAAARDKTRLKTGLDTLLIDAHNCAEKGSGCIYFGTKSANSLIDLTELVSQKAKDNKTQGIEVGYAQKSGYKTKLGIGSLGIQVLLVKTDSQKTAYILFDGNNMVMGLREEILSSISSLVEEAEVLTTDNHAVNATIGGFNPVGLRMNQDTLIKDVVTLVKSAISDLEDVEVGLISGSVNNINVFGHENVTRLSSVVNSTMAIMKITTFASLLFAVVTSTLLLILV
jgi:putative membrane protein